MSSHVCVCMRERASGIKIKGIEANERKRTTRNVMSSKGIRRATSKPDIYIHIRTRIRAYYIECVKIHS